ncbi:MAG TPA: AAA domain-containing protein [Candidatus Poseidoniaceae archaeon]|nr:AAA domain-containing protein [Candidatus Poseidoniaceae archaeon]
MNEEQRRDHFKTVLFRRKIICFEDLISGIDDAWHEQFQQDFETWYNNIHESEGVSIEALIGNLPPSQEQIGRMRLPALRILNNEFNLHLNLPRSGQGNTNTARQMMSEAIANQWSPEELNTVQVMVLPRENHELEGTVKDCICLRDFTKSSELEFTQEEWDNDERRNPDDTDEFSTEHADLLYMHKNIILEGPPGTGKTFALKQIVKKLNERNDIEVGANATGKYAVTMHPATNYEDFIEGLRPSLEQDEQGEEERGGSRFEYRAGSFIEIVKDAIKEPDKTHVVLLDELNRCNVPSVLGDLLTLIEPSKRTESIASVDDVDEDGPTQRQRVHFITGSEVTTRPGTTTYGIQWSKKKGVNLLPRSEVTVLTNPEEGNLILVPLEDRNDVKSSNFGGQYNEDIIYVNEDVRQELDSLISGISLLVIDGEGFPVVQEGWQRYLLAGCVGDPPERPIQILNKEGERVEFEVCEHSRIDGIPIKHRYFGTMTIQIPLPECVCDEEQQSEHYWCNPCDQKWSKNNRTEVRLSGSRKLLHIPDNLYIVGTMNTTDRSVAPMDSAMRRRFIFIRQDPMKRIPQYHYNSLLETEGFMLAHNLWRSLNKRLKSVLGADATIGHSYLFDLIETLDECKEVGQYPSHIKTCWKYSILPQITDMLDATGSPESNWDEINNNDENSIKTKLKDYYGLELIFDHSTNMIFNRSTIKDETD